MSLPQIFMYSGQGSQYYQMGRVLFEENYIFRNSMINTNRIYQEITGISVLKHLYNEQLNIDTPFKQTSLTHSAIFMIEHALTQVLLENDVVPDMVLGYSMGEFAASVVAGVLDFESAFSALIKKSQMLEICPNGGMLAILADPDLFKSESYLYNNSELAAINFNTHFVIAGSSENLQFIIKKLDENKIYSQLLPVSQAFHSSLIDSAKEPFLHSIKNLTINKPQIPYISCKNARAIDTLQPIHFWDIGRSSILFQSTILLLEEKQPFYYIDLGPSGTLATFVKYNLSSASKSIPLPVISPFGNDDKNLTKVIELLNKSPTV